MKNGVYRLADHTFSLTSLHGAVHRMLRGFESEERAEFSVTIAPEDIDFERELSAEPYSDAYFETLAVYRKLAHALLRHDVLLFHASAVAVDGQAYLFAAPSGTGKSTHAALWRELLGARAVMVNDDKPLLHVAARGVTVFGTPWSGKHGLHTNLAVPVRAVCLLHRASENAITQVTPEAALPVLLGQTYRPAAREELVHTLALVERLGESVSLWSLGCTPDITAARLAYETMSEQ